MFLFLFSLLLGPSVAFASDDYPRSCKDATAVFNSARAYSKSASPSAWDIERFKVAQKEYIQCGHDSKDAEDFGYAVLGMINADIFIRYYYAQMAHISNYLLRNLTLTERRFFFNASRDRALHYLSLAKYID